MFLNLRETMILNPRETSKAFEGLVGIIKEISVCVSKRSLAFD